MKDFGHCGAASRPQYWERSPMRALNLEQWTFWKIYCPRKRARCRGRRAKCSLGDSEASWRALSCIRMIRFDDCFKSKEVGAPLLNTLGTLIVRGKLYK